MIVGSVTQVSGVGELSCAAARFRSDAKCLRRASDDGFMRPGKTSNRSIATAEKSLLPTCERKNFAKIAQDSSCRASLNLENRGTGRETHPAELNSDDPRNVASPLVLLWAIRGLGQRKGEGSSGGFGTQRKEVVA